MRGVLIGFLTITLVIKGFGQIDEVKVSEFARSFAERHEMSLEEINTILNNAKFRSDIIEKMERPAEGTMTWGRYRNIFLKEDRIKAGVEFWAAHEETLAQVTADTGIPEEVILGIIGVETFYGQRIGSYRVLDALYTLAFGFPKRSSFFKAELEKFLELAKEEHLDIYSIKGSYAGAIGFCQFMPSSYLAYAKSYDDDGSRNLMEVNDAIASVANYLAAHRWDAGATVTTAVSKTINPQPVVSKSSKPNNTLKYFAENGYMPSGNFSPSAKAALIEFEGENGKEYWFGFWNFYVITRYNHSPMYAMAVYQLGEEVKKRYDQIKP